MIRLPACKSGVRKQNRKRRTGALPALPTSLRPLRRGRRGLRAVARRAEAGCIRTAGELRLGGHFGLVAQSAEQPVVCGKAEGATPFESAIFQILRRDTGSRCVGPALPMKQSPRCAPSTPGRPARGVAATCPAWDRVTAGALPFAKRTSRLGKHFARLGKSNPAALTNFKSLPWPNT